MPKDSSFIPKILIAKCIQCLETEGIDLVYCTKCGTQNEDDAKICVKCGAPLDISRPARRYRSDEGCFGSGRRHREDECFGLPHGGAIAGIIFGIIIVLFGLAVASKIDLGPYLGALVLVIFGILIIAGALYGMRRRY